jgi:hypothetical protein
MPEHPSLPTIAASVAGFFGLLVVACQSPGSARIVGPDGSPMAHVHCGADQGACFRIAGQLCPAGYEMKPVLSGNDGNFLVACRAARPVARAERCPTPASAFALASPTQNTLGPTVPAQRDAWPRAADPPLMQPWPPATEPPLMYPWPPPEASTAVRAAPQTSTAPQRDMGY